MPISSPARMKNGSSERTSPADVTSIGRSIARISTLITIGSSGWFGRLFMGKLWDVYASDVLASAVLTGGKLCF